MESRKKEKEKFDWKNLIKNKKFLISAGVVLIALIAVTGFLLGGNDKKKPVESFRNQEKGSGIFSALTGEEVKPEVLDRRPIAVMIENYWEARPQSGLDKADVVYEILAEGGITRFLAIYQQNDATEIGPVRSARPYFIQRVLEYDPMYAHVGGTPQALNDIKKYNIPDLNEMYLGTAVFSRSAARVAPHNTYTSTEKMRAYAKEKGYEKKVDVPGFAFLKAGQENKNGTVAQKVNIDYPARENKVIYEYDASTKLYKRSHATGIHKDNVTDKQLTAKNIIIQYLPYRVIDAKGGYLAMEMIGQGKAMLITGGKVYTGQWSKDGDRDKTNFTDSDGNELKLNPGQTWIEVVPTETPVSVQ